MASTQALTLKGYEELIALRRRRYPLGGADDPVSVSYVIRALRQFDWPYDEDDAQLKPIRIWESPGSRSTKSASLVAMELHTPLRQVRFVKRGALPLPHKITDYKDWFDAPISNIPIPIKQDLPPIISSENDVLQYRELLLQGVMRGIYNEHPILPRTLFRSHRDNSSGTSPIRADLAGEIVYNRAFVPTPVLSTPNYNGTERDFERAKAHVLNRDWLHPIGPFDDSLFGWAMEVKPDRVLAEHMGVMLELAHFDDRWDGLPEPPASLHSILTKGSHHDDAEYEPEGRHAALQSSPAVRRKGGAIWSQEHSYLIERCTPYGMIASTNVFFLTMLDPYDHGILLVDGPYWRKEFLERNTDEREQWSKESSDLMDRKPSLTSQDEPWVLMRKDFLRMQKAGYGGPSTFADLLEYAFHTLLLRTDIRDMPVGDDPQQVPCLMSCKANTDERLGRRLEQALLGSPLQCLVRRTQAILQGMFLWPRIQWAHYVLGHAPCVVVHTVQGALPVPYTRQEPALPRTWFDFVILYAFSWILALFLPKVLHLNLYARCPRSGRCHAFRGVYCDVPFVVRILRTPRAGEMTSEWSMFPRGPTVSQLPIPRQYGLFYTGENHEMILTSDNGVTLDRLDKGARMQALSLADHAYRAMKNAGIEVTDAGLWNVVWDGHRVTVIDYVDTSFM